MERKTSFLEKVPAGEIFSAASGAVSGQQESISALDLASLHILGQVYNVPS